MRAALIALLACAPAPPAWASPSGAPIEIGVASSLEKLRPSDPAPPARAIELVAARGECEAAQIGVRAPAGIAALAADAGPLGAAVRIPLSLYRVATLGLARGSGPDGCW